MPTIYRGCRDPWKKTALYEVWKGMMRTARRQWRQSLRDKTGEDDLPVDPIFREFYKFRLWAWFCRGYRAGESDGWALARRSEHEPFSPENCYFSHLPARDDGKRGITRGASDGNYCPENCRWAGSVEQHLNTRDYCGTYKNLRLTAADALSVLARIPGTVVVTLCIRSEHLPDDLPPETDFGPVPVERRIDTVINRAREKT